jgi:sec-independent protein translocase protein TatA
MGRMGKCFPTTLCLSTLASGAAAAHYSAEIPCNPEKQPDVGNAMSFLASFMNLAGPDLIVILLIILVLFGAKKLPELARGMGQAVKEFQKAKDEFNDELHKAGKSETEVAKPDVKPAESIVARTETQTTPTITPPQPAAAVTPGDKPDQV